MSDISRHIFDAHKKYSGVRWQQGRVIIDDDLNENERIRDDDVRKTRIDIVGQIGSPDNGFAIHFNKKKGELVTEKTGLRNNALSFEIHQGTFFIGGMRLELGDSEPFHKQSGWCQGADFVPPVAAGNTRIDLVYLEAWQQDVSAIEDNELIEKALGGPDTSSRVRKMHRVMVETNIPTDSCEDEWKNFLIGKRIIDNNGNKVDRATCKVEFQNNGGKPDLCTPKVAEGYLGADNQAIRIQLVDDQHFTWGFDNASALYRAILSKSNGDIKVDLLNKPRDSQHRIERNKIVEVLQYGSKLPNNEYVAEMSGRITKIDQVLSDNESFVIKQDPQNPIDIKSYPSGIKGNAYIRIWERGNSLAVQPECIFNIKPAGNLIGTTGLKILLSDINQSSSGKDDFWIVAARPNSSEDKNKTVAPWSLTDNTGLEPQGVKRFYAPLAIIEWSNQNNIISGRVIHDCRENFLPLTEIHNSPCLPVEPGQDIYRAVQTIIKSGGGCIYLLPGEHTLTKAVDLSGHSGIQFRGFGSQSKLYISDSLNDPSAFILSDNRDIVFESFNIINRTAKTVWSCKDVHRLNITNMFVSQTLQQDDYAIITIDGAKCSQWIIDNCVFFGPSIISGTLLSDSSLRKNIFQGSIRGIDLEYLQRTNIQGNRFAGIHHFWFKHYNFAIAGLKKNKVAFNKHIFNMNLKPFKPPERWFIAPDFIGIDASSVFDVDIIDNYFEGSIGFSSEMMENTKINSNVFYTTVVGASTGMAYGFSFTGNRIGTEEGVVTKEKAVQCRVGLVIQSDAVGCKICNNDFENVREGIVFESDDDGKRLLGRDFSVNLVTTKLVTNKVTLAGTKAHADASKKRIDKLLIKRPLVKHPFFKIGKCEHVLIQANKIKATQIGIEWSGTKNIVDFRISNNSFIGCQDVAVQIEPDDILITLADPVDTKVRLIEKNRFEVYSGAVRSTIGAVRVEKNDIRIKKPLMFLVPPINFVVAAANNVYRFDLLTEAAKKADMTGVKAALPEAKYKLDIDSTKINFTGLKKAFSTAVYNKTKVGEGDVTLETAFILAKAAAAKTSALVATIVNIDVPRLMVSEEGYAVNLSGTQNRIVHNRVYCDNSNHPNGAMFHMLSGEVRDNEINVPGTALHVSSKLAIFRFAQGIEITGNSLISSGMSDQKIAAYALAIPNLIEGNISIANNQFNGTVMIGGDPIAARKLSEKDSYKIPKYIMNYSPSNYDTLSLVVSAAAVMIPAITGAFGKIEPAEMAFSIWDDDPNVDRPVIQFANNRVIQGWLGIFQALSGSYWSESMLYQKRHNALIGNINGNILDYGGTIVGYELILIGNHSQESIQYRVYDKNVQAVANIPNAKKL
jgi:hypothetical protein